MKMTKTKIIIATAFLKTKYLIESIPNKAPNTRKNAIYFEKLLI